MNALEIIEAVRAHEAELAVEEGRLFVRGCGDRLPDDLQSAVREHKAELLVAARRLGLDTVPVIFLDLTVEQARTLNLALNQIHGGWDEDLLARLLADLQASSDADLTLSGFAEDDVRSLLRRLDQRDKRERVETFD